TAVSEVLQHVFGISSFSLAIKVDSQIEQMIATSLNIAKQTDKQTFKIDTRRSYKQFPMISDEVNRAIATEILKQTSLKVDVKKPELRIEIEIHQFETYIMVNRIKGAGGYPVGVGGKALVMLSGGIDSPVASYLTMKRGVSIECIHYASPPYTSDAAQEKVLQLARSVAGHQGHIRVHIVPFTDLQLAIYQHCDESYAITIMRRMMYRIAERVCEKSRCLAIVNGESIGQVASQTLESMQTINHVIQTPVIRPVATMDKLEIINIAKQIHTYDISIQPFEDCCTIFTPKNPVTKPTVHHAEKMENKFDYEKLLAECIENIQCIDVYPIVDQNSDLF
ncbi:MAG: tRNA 4-thiouridine(8) synthase ThiI, partial [Erysipelotrichaceae bacterium]|nr:tRNA 4-thiouridine(8) synthase ThiI [Erysipelotrichaceae bacterium]